MSERREHGEEDGGDLGKKMSDGEVGGRSGGGGKPKQKHESEDDRRKDRKYSSEIRTQYST